MRAAWFEDFGADMVAAFRWRNQLVEFLQF